MKNRFWIVLLVIGICASAIALHAEILLINRDAKKHDIIISEDINGSMCYGKMIKFTLDVKQTKKSESGWICIDGPSGPFLLRDGKKYEIKDGKAYPIWE